jgi:hypothetical protein
MESIQQYFKGGTDFNKRCSVNIRRVGDLVTKCYLECTIDNLCYDTDFLLGPIIVYAMNYNFLKIESGMAALEFSN